MTTPIIEDIAANVLTTVATVTTGNGYNQTLTASRVKRLMWRTSAWEDLSCVVVQGDAERLADLVGADTVAEKMQEFRIVAYAVDSDDATATIDTRLNQIAADIQKAMMIDITRNSKAIDTILDEPEFFDMDAKTSVVAVIVRVKYRVKISDPYTQR